MEPKEVRIKLQEVILLIEELIDTEIKCYHRYPSTVLKVEHYSKLVKELKIAQELSDSRSKTYSINKIGINEQRKIEDFKFIKSLNMSELVDNPKISRNRDANDPNEIRRFNPTYLTELKTECEGIFGEKYEVDLDDHIGYKMYMDGYFDIGLIGFLLYMKNEKSCTTLIDVGANIGSVSIPLAINGIDCVGIEANPTTYMKLTKNISMNQLSNYEAINKAAVSHKLGNGGETLKLYVPKGNTGAASLHEDWNPSKGEDNNTVVHCHGDTIDNLLIDKLEHGAITIKIDIEGGEADAIEGARDTINKYKPIIIIEWNQRLNRGGCNLNDILKKLPNSYEVASLTTKEKETRKLLEITTGIFDPQKSYENIIIFDGSNNKTKHLVNNFCLHFSEQRKVFADKHKKI